MNQKKLPQKNNKPLVILDTNIIGYLVDKKRIDTILDSIENLAKENELSISLFTYYEIVSLGNKDVPILIQALNTFKRLSVDLEVLTFAALMRLLKVKKDGDSILAATAFLNDARILTANGKDFPEPYFHEDSYFELKFKDNINRTAVQTIHLLKNDFKKTVRDIEKLDVIKAARDKNKKIKR